MAVGGLEKAISSVSHPSSNPLAKPATNIPTHSHQSHTQRHSEETLIAKRGGKQLMRKARANLGTVLLSEETGGFVHSLAAERDRSNRTTCLHTTKKASHRRRGTGEQCSLLQRAQHRPQATFPCKVLSPAPAEEMSPPEGQLLAGSHTYFPPMQPPCLHSLVACLLFSVFPAHHRLQDPLLSPTSM